MKKKKQSRPQPMLKKSYPAEGTHSWTNLHWVFFFTIGSGMHHTQVSTHAWLTIYWNKTSHLIDTLIIARTLYVTVCKLCLYVCHER